MRDRPPAARRNVDRPHVPSAPSEKVFGLAAARAVLQVRPTAVQQIAHTKEVRAEVAELLRTAAKHRIAYREVTRQELERIADSVHHEGVCIRVIARPRVEVPALAQALRGGGFVLALDGVENPHNVGAVLRSAAYFGALGLVVGGTKQKNLGPASVRVAEGGAEHVPVCYVPALADALGVLREAGAKVVGCDAHRGTPLGEFRWPRATVLVLGSERTGLSRAVQAHCEAELRIPGSGAVESLNVSVAAGVAMAACAAARR